MIAAWLPYAPFHPIAEAIGWTLLHSLWQGALIAVTLGTALAVLSSSRSRYGAALLAMAALLASWAITLANLWPSEPQGLRTAALPLPAHPVPMGTGPAQAPFSTEVLIPWLAPVWMAGVATLLLRHALGWFALSRMKSRGVCDPPAGWQQALVRLALHLRISRPVRLLESSLVEAPVVLGHLRPLILIPAGFLAQLPVEQVEAILLHELAHIRRNDYLVNLLQRLAEAVLFYHPAAWWISYVLRNEREYCCDDIAIEAHGSAFVYASALTALEQHRSGALEPALGATGGSLMKRIRRILQPTRPTAPSLALFPAAVLLIAAAASLAAWQADRPSPMPKSPEPAAKAARVFPVPTEKELARMEEEAERLARQADVLRKGRQLTEKDYRATEKATRALEDAVRQREEAQLAQSDRALAEADLQRAQAERQLEEANRQLAQASFPIELEKMSRDLAEMDRKIAAASSIIAEFGRELRSEDAGVRLERMARISQELKQAVNRELRKPPPQDLAAAQARTPYDAWLNEDVAYIISGAERSAFLRLTTDAERKMFIEQFWLRRDPTPGTPANEAQTEHYRRIGYAMERYLAPDGQRGWRTDRGRVYIQYGPPDEMEAHLSGGPSSPYPYESWRYRHLEGVGDNVMLLFIDRTRTGDYRWTQDPKQ